MLRNLLFCPCRNEFIHKTPVRLKFDQALSINWYFDVGIFYKGNMLIDIAGLDMCINVFADKYKEEG